MPNSTAYHLSCFLTTRPTDDIWRAQTSNLEPLELPLDKLCGVTDGTIDPGKPAATHPQDIHPGSTAVVALVNGEVSCWSVD